MQIEVDRDDMVAKAKALLQETQELIDILSNKKRFVFRALDAYSDVIFAHKKLNEVMVESGMHEHDVARTCDERREEFIDMFENVKYTDIDEQRQKRARNFSTIAGFDESFEQLIESPEAFIDFRVELSDKDKGTEKGKALLKLVDDITKEIAALELVSGERNKYEKRCDAFTNGLGKKLVAQVLDMMKDPSVDKDAFKLLFPYWAHFNQVKADLIPMTFED